MGGQFIGLVQFLGLVGQSSPPKHPYLASPDPPDGLRPPSPRGPLYELNEAIGPPRGPPYELHEASGPLWPQDW